jgi:hypothetical protein
MQAAHENPDTGGLHFIVERINFTGHRLVLRKDQIVAVGAVNRYQIFLHDYSIFLLRMKASPPDMHTRLFRNLSGRSSRSLSAQTELGPP